MKTQFANKIKLLEDDMLNEIKYDIYIVKQGSDIIWKKKVPSDSQNLTIQKYRSNLKSEDANREFDRIKTTG